MVNTANLITHLDVMGAKFTDASFFTSLESLRVLNLSRTCVTDIACLSANGGTLEVLEMMDSKVCICLYILG